MTHVNLNRISDTFGIPVDQLKRKSGPIDLLIGINHPHFHVRETRVKDGLADTAKSKSRHECPSSRTN